mmetsp:Transcript_17886/g.42267  ORF Transcript_17886/g.42267 Transcript_17886/m.42267 type:complete len:526 (-) Transcript_17886:348-1925(-)
MHRQRCPFPRLIPVIITIIASQAPTIANSFGIMSDSCCKAKALSLSAEPVVMGRQSPNTTSSNDATPSATTPVAGSKTSSMLKRTFYRRPMPNTCVALSSPEGRKIFASAHNSRGLKSFFPLVEQFATQTEPAYCGPTTLVVILNALAVDPRRTWKGPWRWYEESFLNCCVDLEEVKKTGITLGTFACLAKCQGLTVEARHGSDASIEEFRDAVEAACLEVESTDEVASSSNNDQGNSTANHQFLAVSYTRKVVGQTGDGHFSPIAAYDEASDSVLVLDTARFKYGPHWIPLQLMYEALQPIDKTTGKSRGYVLLSYGYSDHDQSSNMPRSILFRSKKGQDPTRRLFKEYLRGMNYEVSFEDVLKFWTKDGQDFDYVWSILDPQLVPTNQEEEDMVTNARSLLTDLVGYVRACSSNASLDKIKERYDERLLHETKSMCADSCEGNSCEDTFTSRKIVISSIEAILVSYLSTMESEQMRKLFQSFQEKSGEKDYPIETYEQILCEADLINYAIEASDESEEDAFGS